jgi:exosortase
MGSFPGRFPNGLHFALQGLPNRKQCTKTVACQLITTELAAMIRVRHFINVGSLLVLGGLLLWAYWLTLAAIVDKWSTPQYSHGYLVPLFAVLLLWLRRGQISSKSLRPTGWGLVPLALGAGMHLVGAYYYAEYLQTLSLLPSLVGLSLCVGGKPAFAWSLPAIGFLFFMLPFPYRVEIMLGLPLRRVAVLASTYILQTVGFPAVAEGNIILMEHAPIAVVEACSGLSMLLTFFALSTGLALVVNRFVIDKFVLVVSALPIAIIANVVRIVTTAILADTVGSDAARLVFHDLAGWLMMPLALGLLALEMVLLSKLFVESNGGGESAFTWDGLGPAATAATMPLPAVILRDARA